MWTQSQTLPYLYAGLREGPCLHPALSLPLHRVVSPTGLLLPDARKTFLPPGTVVGINAWLLHRNKRIFGSDADNWDPYHWLDADKSTLSKVESNILLFGAGKGSCLGRDIAMLELHKVVPAVLLGYNLRLADPEKE